MIQFDQIVDPTEENPTTIDLESVVAESNPEDIAEEVRPPADVEPETEDSVRLYLREIARVPLLKAEEEVVLAKGMQLGRQIQAEPWKAILSLHEWTLHATETKTRSAKPEYALPLGSEAHRIVGEALASEAAMDLLVTAPRFGLADALQEAPSDQAREAIEEAKKANRADLIEGNEAEIKVLEVFLPKAMPADELRALVQAAIAETGAAAPSDMGKVMKVVMPKVAGRAPNDMISTTVKELLTK